MGECPNLQCKKNLDEVRFLVSGDGPDKGLRGEVGKIRACLNKKLSSFWAWLFILTFGMALITGGYNVYHKVQVVDDIQKDVKENTKGRIEMQSDIKHIKIALDDIKRILQSP